MSLASQPENENAGPFSSTDAPLRAQFLVLGFLAALPESPPNSNVTSASSRPSLHIAEPDHSELAAGSADARWSTHGRSVGTHAAPTIQRQPAGWLL